MGKVIRELSDEEVQRLGLDDFPYIEEEFENIKDDDDVIGVAIPKDDNKIIKFPVSTDEKNMKNKKCDYKLLSTLTLLSKYNTGEDHRYIYKDDIILNKDKVEMLSGKKINTVIKNVRKLSKLEGNAVIAKEVNGKIVYIINYKNKKGRKYVIVEEDILRSLLDTGSSNLIKTYMLLKYRCNEETETRITRKDIAINIGLNGDSKDNLKTITNIIKDLKKKDLIKVNTKYDNKLDANGNFKYAKYLYIRLCNYQEWKTTDDKAIKEK